MHSIRISLVAVALLFAVTPDDASASSDQYCEDQWLLSSASDSCTTDLSVTWRPDTGECSVSVKCTEDDGSLRNNYRTVKPEHLPNFENCDGLLVWVC